MIPSFRDNMPKNFTELKCCGDAVNRVKSKNIFLHGGKRHE